MTRRLHCDVFLALCAVGWADGRLDPEEAAAIVAAAVEAGLSAADIARIEAVTRTPVTLDAMDVAGLSLADRAFVYAAGVWLARLDGAVEPRERQTLHAVGKLLGLPERVRAEAAAAVLEIAQLPAGDRPGRYDLHRLRERVLEYLQLSHEAS